MNSPPRPRLRSVESFPVSQPDGKVLFAMRDPDGMASSIALAYPAALLASLMDGQRSLAEIQSDFQARSGVPVALADVGYLVAQLDERWFLDNDRFRQRWKVEMELYLNSSVRPAAHANSAYPGDPELLRRQLDGFFTGADGPGPIATAPAARGDKGRLCGLLSPHVDIERGGAAYAWAYKRLAEESDADLFIIFGTAHKWMSQPFAVSRKHYDTPLGTVQTDERFLRVLAAKLAAQPGGDELNLAGNELAHRHEHSIEFQVVWLQHVLGGQRPLKIVPILVGSFQQFVSERWQPSSSPQVAAFVSAVCAAAAEHAGRVCYIGGVDLAHIGQRYGDAPLLTAERLREQTDDDLTLLAAACRSDAAALFEHVARQDDRYRICGLSPSYTMLEVLRPARGELLKYGQAVAPDGTSCVSFASVAFYE